MTAFGNLQADGIRVMFGGDVMLGRGVTRAMLQNGAHYPLAPIADLMRGVDAAIVNLECAMTSCTTRWAGRPKAFYFGAHPCAVLALERAGVDMVSLANNHVLDFGEEGLRDTLRLLHKHGIRHAGAGEDLDAALAPAIGVYRGIRLGMAAFCDHQEDFAAGADRSGIARIDLGNESKATEVLHAALDRLTCAACDWPILSLHWGPNMTARPSRQFRSFAHTAIDMGWKILFGHSAHVFQGIEIHRGCPIIYAAGDLVDDYYVDHDFRNDHQLLFELELTRTRMQSICLHPVFIENCQACPATGEQYKYIADRMTSLCHELGTEVVLDKDGLRIWIDSTRGSL